MNYPTSPLSRRSARWTMILLGFACFLLIVASVSGCKKAVQSQARPPAEVSVVKIEPRDTPIVVEFVAQTQSSHQVEIRARVNAFLEKRTYVEGSAVKAGQVMFKMDPKPFQTQLDAEQGALEQQQARLITARANLKRVKPLAEQDALSQKDLDDATGQEQAAAAAVATAKANVEQAKLNLSYTTISSPVTGLSSFARIQDGAYVSQANSLLTYVAQTDPMWVNFSISENDVLKYRGQAAKGQLIVPKEGAYGVEVLLGDGSMYPYKGRITFADAEYNTQTGTFLVRATIPNPKDLLRPGQFVRAHLLGAIRPKAILVPLRAVQQGSKGHFVWVVGKDGKAESRPVVVGDWQGNNWFITEGLLAGDQVVVDGGLTLQPGAAVTIKAQASAQGSEPGAPVTVKAETPAQGSAPTGAPKANAGKTEAVKGEK